MRADFKILEQWVQPESRVLDLGCGDGTLLSYLQSSRHVSGYGLEIDSQNICECVEKGVNVIEQDLDGNLSNFTDNSFDTVIMTQALQAVNRPLHVLQEMLRIGQEGIITFPNFAYWRTRLFLFTKGMMPVSKTLPYSWFDTPNIHLCTFKDFELLCQENNIVILNRTSVDSDHETNPLARALPNLFGEIAIYRVTLK